MTEAQRGADATPATAGSLLRAARQAQGLHIAVLAAAIKVTPRKLESLEADRYDELPDATFTRALAQTVCRTLKIDPAPVLALLPQSGGYRIEQVSEGLNAPFREGRARGINQPSRDWSRIASPAVVAPVLVLVLAAVLWALPPGALEWRAASRGSAASAASSAAPATAPSEAMATAALPASADASSAAEAPSANAPASAASAMVETVALAPPSGSSDAGVAPVAGVLVLRTSAESWIEVLDAGGATLLSRVVQPGETVGLDGAMPLKLKVGNAAATQLVFRGKPLDLAPSTRDNVARLELK